MSHKSVPSMLSLLAAAGVALMAFSPARQAWQICLCVHADRSTPGRCIRPPCAQPGRGAVRDRRPARRTRSRKVLAGLCRLAVRQSGPDRDAGIDAGCVWSHGNGLAAERQGWKAGCRQDQELCEAMADGEVIEDYPWLLSHVVASVLCEAISH